jgi:hypothetical protein
VAASCGQIVACRGHEPESVESPGPRGLGLREGFRFKETHRFVEFLTVQQGFGEPQVSDRGKSGIRLPAGAGPSEVADRGVRVSPGGKEPAEVRPASVFRVEVLGRAETGLRLRLERVGEKDLAEVAPRGPRPRLVEHLLTCGRDGPNDFRIDAFGLDLGRRRAPRRRSLRDSPRHDRAGRDGEECKRHGEPSTA